MDNLRTRAQEIREAGEAARGNFKPPAVAKRIYSYWLEHSDSQRARGVRAGTERENFCHFGRVILFWAPLMFVKRGVQRVVDNDTFPKVALTLAAIAFIVGVSMTDGGWTTLLISVAVMVGIAIAAVAIVFAGRGIQHIFREHWNHDWDDKVLNGIAVVAGVLGIGAILFSLGALIADFGLIVLVILAGAIAFVAAGAFAVNRLVTYFAGKRALRQKEWNEKYEKWLRDEGPHPRDEVEVREPGKIAEFFSGVLDMLILVGQIIRVKKWKMCPMVEIDQ